MTIDFKPIREKKSSKIDFLPIQKGQSAYEAQLQYEKSKDPYRTLVLNELRKPENIAQAQQIAQEGRGFWPELMNSLTRGTLNVAAGLGGTVEKFAELADKPGLNWLGKQAGTMAAMSRAALEIPEYAPGEKGGAKEFVAQAVGEAFPYMAGATAATLLTGTPAGAFGVGFAVEGENAYQEAINSGATEEQANMERLIVGTLNGAIEQLQVGGLLKGGKKAAQPIIEAAKDKALKKIARAGAQATIEWVKTAISEGLEEALQEAVSMTAPVLHGQELPSPQEYLERAGKAGLGGMVAGGILGGAGAIAQSGSLPNIQFEQVGKRDLGAESTTKPEIKERTEQPPPPKERTEQPVLRADQFPIQEVPVDSLILSEDVPNFKEGADKTTGVIKGQELQGKYNRLGTAPILVWERKNGNREVITGRHRLDLAKRTGEKTIPAQIVRESEGFTKAMALTADAESNIRDGQGSVKDYVQYFRNTEISEESARERGLLSRAKGKIGFRIGKSAVDDVYAAFLGNKLSEAKAYAIANGAPNNESAQLAAAAKADKLSPDELEQYARILSRTKPSDTIKPVQGNLFGFDESALMEAEAVAKEVAKEEQAIKERILAVKGALRRPETAKKMGLEFSDEAHIRAEVERLENRLDDLKRVSTTPELYEEMRQRAGLAPTPVSAKPSKYDKDLLGQDVIPPLTGEQKAFLDPEDYRLAEPDVEGQMLLTDISEQEKPVGKPASSMGKKGAGVSNEIDRGEVKVSLEPSGKPMNAGEIIRQLERDFKIPIRGKATHTMRKTLGWFDPRAVGIRMKNVREITTATHEIGHHIDWTLNHRLSKNPPTQQMADELMALGKSLYGSRKPAHGYKSEGWAEFMRMYLTGEDTSEAAPNIHQWFTKNYLPSHPDIARKIERARQMITAWRMQGAEERIDSHINTKPIKGTIGERLQRLSLWLDTMFRDEFAPLRRALKRSDLWGKLAPSEDPYQLAVAFADKAGSKARQFVLDGTTDLAGNINGKSLKEILKPIRDMKAFTRYVIAKRAMLLHDRGINPGISKADARYVIDKYQNPEWDTALKELTDWNHKVLDYLVEAGGMEKEVASHIKAMNPIYVPFMRAFAAGEKQGSEGTGKGFTKTGKAVKKIKGSGREIIDPFESMIQQVERIISIAQKSKVALAIAKIADRPNMASLIWEVPAPKQATSFSAEQIKKDVASLAVKKLGLDPHNINMAGLMEHWDDILTVYTNANNFFGKENIVGIVVDGKKRWYEVSPELFRVLEGLDQYTLPPFLNMTLGKATRGIRLGATGLNPAFGLIRNLIRDAMTFSVLSKHAKGGPISALSGIGEDIVNTASARKFKALGGKMAGQIMHDRTAAQRLKSEMLQDRTIAGKYVLKTVTHPVQALRELFSITEAGTRIGEFSAALKDAEAKYGKGTLDAAIYALNQAQDVTTNFTRHGKISKVLNQMIPFFNAAIQGPDKLVRTFAERPVETSLRAMAMLTVPALGLWWAYKDDEWYKNLPDYEKINYLHFKIPGKDIIVRLPVPFELGHIFQSLPVAALNSRYTENPEELSEAMVEILDQANPFGSRWIVPGISLVGPAIQVATNKDWAGRPIVPMRVQGKLPEDQYTEYTTELMKHVGKAIGVSPAKLEYIVDAYSGGLYRRLGRGVDVVTGKREYETGLPDVPVIGTLFTREPYAPKPQLEKFYQTRDRLNRMHQSGKLPAELKKQRAAYNKIGNILNLYMEKLRNAKTEEERKQIYQKVKRLLEKTNTYERAG